MEKGEDVVHIMGAPLSHTDSRMESTVAFASKLNGAADVRRAHEDTVVKVNELRREDILYVKP